MKIFTPHKESILIIDDQPENLQVLSRILQEQGYEVRQAITAELALKTVRVSSPDLILLDIMLPDMPGYEVCRRLKSDELTCEIPVIFISALDDTKDKLKAFDVGGIDYLTKPFQEKEVLARVKTHLILQGLRTELEEKNTALEQEIRERKQAEETMRVSEAQKQAILDGITTNIAFVNQTLEIIWVNKTAAESVHKRPEDMIGRRCHEFWANPEKPCENCPTVRAFQSHKSEHILMETPDGRVWNEKGEPVFNADGVLIGVVEIAEDITERRQAEMKLKEYSERLEEMVEERTKELEKAQEELLIKERLAVLGHFAGSIAHEMNNPLAVIDSAVYILKRKMKTDDKKISDYLDSIARNVNRSTNIIESLRNLSRMEKPNAILQDAEDLVSEALHTSDIPDTVNVMTDFPEDNVMIHAEKEQIRIALKNLIKNSVQAMDENGKLTLSMRLLESTDLEITVSDTGPGISPEHLEKVFEPLFSTKTHGIGFGLSIVKMIIENHGGKIRAESELGSGAAFIITLPLAEKI